MTHTLLTSMTRQLRPGALTLGLVLLVSCGKSGGSTEPPVEPPPGSELPQFAYPSRKILAERGVAMVAQTPEATGNAPIETWALEGVLPSGVVFNPADGSISGTPGELAEPRSLTVTTTNSDGSFDQRLSLSVSGITRFAFGANDADNTLSLFSVGDDVESQDPRIFEHNSFLAQSPGEISPQDVQADPQGRLIYSLNQFSITPYLVDSQRGLLEIGTPIGLGTGPHSLFVHPGGEFIYISSAATDRVRAFAVDAVLGSLQVTQQVTTGVGPTDLAGDPNGHVLVVGHETGEVLHSFLIDSVSGSLTLAGTTDLPTVVSPDIEMGPLGESLYVVLQEPFEGVLRCIIDSATGQITLGPTSLTGTGPRAMTVEPGRRFAYVLNKESADISYYSIAEDNGNLTKLGELSSTSGTVSLRFTRDGQCAVAIDESLQLARVYRLEADGKLNQTSEFRLRKGPQAMAFIDGTQTLNRVTDVMYSLNTLGNDITIFHVDPGTGLVSDGGLPAVPTEDAPSDIALDPLGRFAFVANGDSETVTVYAMQPNGDLVDNLTPLDVGGTTPTALVVDPTGRFLYAALAGFNLVGMFSIGTDGSLTSIGTRPTKLPAESLEIDPTGQHLYAVRGGDSVNDFGSVRGFDIDPLTGELTKIVPLIAAVGHPMMLEFAAGGTRVYSPQRDLDMAFQWDLELDGILTAIPGSSPTQTEPVDIALTPNEKFAFVVCLDPSGQGSMLTYDIEEGTGRLYNAVTGVSTWRNVISPGINPVAVEVSHDGMRAYVLSETSEELRVYRINPDTAFLTELQVITRGLRPTKLVRRDTLQ